MNDLRAELAREWAKKHNIQLSLFSEQYQKDLRTTKREKKLSKELKNEGKSKEICQGIRAKKDKGELDEKEFKQMCKKARVDWHALCDTIFKRSIEKAHKKKEK